MKRTKTHTISYKDEISACVYTFRDHCMSSYKSIYYSFVSVRHRHSKRTVPHCWFFQAVSEFLDSSHFFFNVGASLCIKKQQYQVEKEQSYITSAWLLLPNSIFRQPNNSVWHSSRTKPSGLLCHFATHI